MKSWIEAALSRVRCGRRCVLVTVAAVRGSAPREPGARMLVTREAVEGTVGGGNLELAAIERARGMLDDDGAAPAQLVRYPLGPGLRQCCGGVATLAFETLAPTDAPLLERIAELMGAGTACVVVNGIEGPCAGRRLVVCEAVCEGTLGDAESERQSIALARDLLAADGAEGAPALRAVGAHPAGLALFERLRPPDFHVVLFGAGHVGRALVDVLAPLDCRVTWVDPREDQFPHAIPPNVRTVATAAPEAEVERAPPGAYFVVMTHSHTLDFELCERALRRGDFRYLGLIGSKPKRQRFRKYLRLEGIAEAALDRLTCPIGVAGITSKAPSAIAVAVAAELLQVYSACSAQALLAPAAKPRAKGRNER